MQFGFHMWSATFDWTREFSDDELASWEPLPEWLELAGGVFALAAQLRAVHEITLLKQPS